mmetsp:Transcript_46990/g.114484  ORF Transcript_46990/g.114484 Transcript_46990/m.114484 type:complete len:133 (-) Transcript_46990:238-636(-)
MRLDGFKALAKAMESMPDLQKLDLSHNEISNLEILMPALGAMMGLECLHLSDNRISDIEVLVPALWGMTELQCLHLSELGITPEGATALAGALRSTKSLRELDISNNLIKHEGREALRTLTQVQTLKFETFW